MTVARMEAEMPNAEYVHWSMFYALRQAEAEVEQKMAAGRGARR
jgi:hypothetical protein